MRLLNFIRSRMYSRTWNICYLLVLSFCAGILVDIDHPLHYYFGWGENGRYLMGYFEVAGYILLGCGIIILIGCVCRFIKLRILRN